MKRKFKKGDKVYCKRFGRGKVVSIDNEDIAYPLKVKFKKSNDIQHYTNDGRYYYIAVGRDKKDEELDIHHVPPNWWQRLINKLKS
jgi:hypothetical protein